MHVGRGIEHPSLSEQRAAAGAFAGEDRGTINGDGGDGGIESDDERARLAGREVERAGDGVTGGAGGVVSTGALLAQSMAAPPSCGAGELSVGCGVWCGVGNGVGNGDEEGGVGVGESVGGEDDGRAAAGGDGDIGEPIGVGIDLMVAAMLDEDACFEAQWGGGGGGESPEDGDGAFVAEHDDAALDAGGAGFDGPGGNAVFKLEGVDAAVAIGVDGSVGPASAGEGDALVVD